MAGIWSDLFYVQEGVASYVPAGPLLTFAREFGPLAASASFVCPASLDTSGYGFDFSTPDIGWFNNWLWNSRGANADTLADFVEFFQLTGNGFPEDGEALSPALLGTYEFGAETGPAVAIARPNWSEGINRFRPVWAVSPITFFEQLPDGTVIHPVTSDPLGSGFWYHAP